MQLTVFLKEVVTRERIRRLKLRRDRDPRSEISHISLLAVEASGMRGKSASPAPAPRLALALAPAAGSQQAATRPARGNSPLALVEGLVLAYLK